MMIRTWGRVGRRLPPIDDVLLTVIQLKKNHGTKSHKHAVNLSHLMPPPRGLSHLLAAEHICSCMCRVVTLGARTLHHPMQISRLVRSCNLRTFTSNRCCASAAPETCRSSRASAAVHYCMPCPERKTSGSFSVSTASSCPDGSAACHLRIRASRTQSIACT